MIQLNVALATGYWQLGIWHTELIAMICLCDHPKIAPQCAIAGDVTATMLVVKNRSISLLWELNSIFM